MQDQPKKIVYLAHPIAGSVDENLQALLEVYSEVHTRFPNIIPFVPYYAGVLCEEARDPSLRERGLNDNAEYFRRRSIDEMWLCGPKISNGMRGEIELCVEYGIPIACYNPDLREEAEMILNGYGVRLSEISS